VEARRSSELGAQTYPRDPFFRANLASLSFILGQYEASLKENLETLRLSPYNRFFYRQVVFNYLLLNRVKEAEAVAEEAHMKGLDSNLAHILYGISFYRDDTANMAR
jgi:hypothetical protein